MWSAICVNFDQSKILLCGNGLSAYYQKGKNSCFKQIEDSHFIHTAVSRLNALIGDKTLVQIGIMHRRKN